MTDEEIADIHQTKLRSIDLGKRIEQHKASANNAIMRDPYSHFRDIPEFHTAAIEQQNKIRSSNVMKQYGLLKKIAGSSSDIGAASNN
jgi:hypothetical protein